MLDIGLFVIHSRRLSFQVYIAYLVKREKMDLKLFICGLFVVNTLMLFGTGKCIV